MPDADGHADALAELAVRATQLGADIRTAQADLSAASEEVVARTGFRLDDAAGQAHAVAGALMDTAVDLRRIGARTDRTCSVEWGCCPVHGASLRSSGGRSWCTVQGCESWDYDRLGLPCEEDAVAVLTFTAENDKQLLVCKGHLAGIDPDALADATITARHINAEET